MALHGTLRLAFRSWICACTLWSLACGSSGGPTQGGGKGGSGGERDAGDITTHHDGGGDTTDSGRDAAMGVDPDQGGSGGSGGSGGTGQSNGGAGGDTAQGGQGGGGSGGAGGSDEVDTSELHIDSFAPSGAEVGAVFRYRVVLDQTGPASYELTTAPDGATIDANGLITWAPSFTQGGESHTFSVKATLGEDEATQQFDVAVTALVLSAQELLDPDSEELQMISVSSPLSEASGVTLTVPPGALSGASSLSISTTSGAPLMPAQSSGGVPLVLGFGPSGSVFNSPLDLVIPLSASTWQRLLSGQGVATAWTLGSDGVWQALPIEYVDLENGYVQIKLQHFSLVGLMASPALLTLDSPKLGGSTCPSGLFVDASFTEAALDTGLDQWLNAEAYNNSGLGPDSKLKAVLSMLPTGHSLQLRLRAVLTDTLGDSKTRQYQIFSMLKLPNGNIDLTVSNEGGNVLYRQADIATDSALVDQALYGDFSHFVFHDFPTMQDGQITLDAYAYLRRPDAPPIVAGSEGQAFASLTELFTYAGLSASSDDDDCDGILNSADTVQTLALPPRISGGSEATLRTTVNMPLTLSVNVISEAAGGVSVSWVGSSPAAMLSPTQDGMQATFVSAMPGTYKVSATATDAAGTTSQTFLVVVDSPVTPNTPPRCKINAKRTAVFTGEQIPLEAVLDDAEQPNQELSVEWSVVAGATLSSSFERRVAFGSDAPAVYDVTCIARDGLSAGQPSTLSITVTERPLNTPPRLSFVAPASATLQIGDNGLASQQIRVTASDIDNDAVAIEFTLLEGDATLSIANSPPNTAGTTYAARTFETAITGPYAVLVRAVDQNNATSESVVVKLLVAQGLSGTDVDRDGFPASVDCNDNDVTVFPGAPEICGDSIDQNCNGSDRALADCDADRDGKTANDGDCDDNNPNVFPGARERCNGRDDNCNATIDEGYVVGSTCSLGIGACAASGTNVCSRDGAATVCTAKPLLPVAETCNNLDDNCNGRVDDVPTQGTADVNNCGGCGTVCTGQANQIAACVPNATGVLGCMFTCSQGYSDLDRDPQNGCEYSCVNPKKEICNAADDDCDGRIDEQSDSQFYPGPEGTLGIGDCRGGLMVCKQGVLVQAIAPITPVTERCDMRDNNCDGKIDEGFQLGGSCDGPDSDLCAYGRFVCSPEGTVVCGLEPNQNIRDICDGADNDCNPNTVDGSGDLAVGKPCDERNPAYCEPGQAMCTAGRMTCSNEGRDATSCKVCECDTTDVCNTNGTGYICPCDPQCTGPDVGCPCDVASGCDLVDGAEECGCDSECVGETACSCDQLDNTCDSIALGFVCACDDDCGASCGCDAAAGVCDKTVSGDVCLCDNDCYPSCGCDDKNPETCAKDSSGNVCQCDPSCRPGGETCACDLTVKSCDKDPMTQAACACDLDCGAPTCNCNTSSSCDKAAGGDACLCDVDCAPQCPCDDKDAMTCPRDSSGNACLCDPSCTSGGGVCDCNTSSGACDNDPQGNACGCDPDCGTAACECDTSQETCDKDPSGQDCGCDPQCGATVCQCNVTMGMCDQGCGCDKECEPQACSCDVMRGVCEQDQAGNPCACDLDCPPPPCECDKLPDACDMGPNGELCGCDPRCGVEPCGCDIDKDVCDKGPNGELCSCDPQCQGLPCDCDLTMGMCDKLPNGESCGCDGDCGPPLCMCDFMKGECDEGCGCDLDCQPSTCDCDLNRGVCDKDPSGFNCGCDPDCGMTACECDKLPDACDMGPNGELCGCDPRCQTGQCECDLNKGMCDLGPNNEACGCDPDCQGGTCGCDLTGGVCDKDPNGLNCMCDKDCSAPVCACDVDPEACDKNPGGDDCLCDQRCYPPCPCADDDPAFCQQDSDGNVCKCDPGCEQAVPPGCACDVATGVCDSDPAGGPCACDPDCGAQPPTCGCNSTDMCDVASGSDPCLCDMSCYPPCACDDGNPMTCARDSAGNACRCDPSCQTDPGPSCTCDVNMGMCDKDQSGANCPCDVDCGPPSTCECDLTGGVCDMVNGQPCGCDLDCEPPPPVCMCDVNMGMCDKDQSGANCPCDVDCGPPPECMCNLTVGMCDMVDGQPCSCDVDCAMSSCVCDVQPNVCDMPQGSICLCDPLCPKP